MRCGCPVHALCMLGGLRGTGRVCIQAFRNDAMKDASQVALHDLEMERDGKGVQGWVKEAKTFLEYMKYARTHGAHCTHALCTLRASYSLGHRLLSLLVLWGGLDARHAGTARCGLQMQQILRLLCDK